jgi:hypothetical protein
LSRRGELSESEAILARAGCVAVGTVYVLIGGVALIALTGHLIEYADPYRLGLLLKRVPGGVILLWGMAVGAAAYAAWRVIQAWRNPHSSSNVWLQSLNRVSVALSGLAYTVFSYSAAQVALRTPPGGRDAPEQHQQQLVARVLEWPAGWWVIGAAGLAVAIVGVVQFGFVVRRSYTREIRMQPRSRTAGRVVHGLAAYGYAARGVILCLLGYFLIKSAASGNPRAVGDTDTAFDFIGGGVVGNTAFAVVALGTLAYGLFMYANAWLYSPESDPGTMRARSSRRASLRHGG